MIGRDIILYIVGIKNEMNIQRYRKLVYDCIMVIWIVWQLTEIEVMEVVVLEVVSWGVGKVAHRE